jgi:hypothetical protein
MSKSKNKKKTYTQKEYDDRGTQMFELGKKEGRDQIKKEFRELFGLDLCPHIDDMDD